jgi:hypothetical protein
MASQDGFDEDSLYDQFPSGDSDGFGFNEGFNRWVHVNDPSLFTEEALQNPAIQAFVNAPFHVTYAQFKSSHRESEYFVHKPHRAMSGDVNGIVGVVEGINGATPRTPIATLVLNHEETLALHITRSLVVSGSGQAGQMIVKEPAP